MLPVGWARAWPLITSWTSTTASAGAALTPASLLLQSGNSNSFFDFVYVWSNIALFAALLIASLHWLGHDDVFHANHAHGLLMRDFSVCCFVTIGRALDVLRRQTNVYLVSCVRLKCSTQSLGSSCSLSFHCQLAHFTCERKTRQLLQLIHGCCCMHGLHALRSRSMLLQFAGNPPLHEWIETLV